MAFVAQLAALALLPLSLSLAQAVLSNRFVLLAVLAEGLFGFSLGPRQWMGVVLVACALSLLGVTGESRSRPCAVVGVSTLFLFESAAVLVGLLFIFSRRIEVMRASARRSSVPRRAWASG